ncbi:TspO/MBR family protein [Pararhizobium mangrovi]|uniref:Tryptophan-rich sensory protein n=1 Tax=Pararhizobium mangrovi TaxID=2590452 RepID=A0A506U9G9_9HYPH|nr:TspO/MBR family protein [Pararhizobium mangrovi]TPW29605.1 tryptophan-rich sensory protein [Pararhizobium mangrovi]
MTLTSILVLIGFLVLVFLVASGGAVFRPGPWYERIDKPDWTPPKWVFPTVWTPLYLLIAISGWLAWREAGFSFGLFTAYVVQLVLNYAWSALFFGLGRADYAFADVVALWIAIAATIASFAAVSALAAWLLVPYLVWVTIASVLNLSVWRRNQAMLAQV